MCQGFSKPKTYNSEREAELDILKVYHSIEILEFENEEELNAAIPVHPAFQSKI